MVYKWYILPIGYITYHLFSGNQKQLLILEFSVKFFFSEATTPRPFGRFWIFAGSRNTSCLAAGEVGVGEGYGRPVSFNSPPKRNSKVGRLQASTFSTKTPSKVVVVENPSILRDAIHHVMRSQHKKWTVFKKQMPQVRMAIATRMTSQ